MNCTWYSNSSGIWVMFGKLNTSATNTTFHQTFANATAYSTKYYWTTNTTDGDLYGAGSNGSSWENRTYSFTTRPVSWANTAPFTNNPNPQSGNTSVSLTPVVSIQVFDNNSVNQSMNCTWYSNSSGAWVMFGKLNTSATNTTFAQTFTNASAHATTYWWTTNVTDGHNTSSWENRTFSFTTTIQWSNTAPSVSNPQPTDGSSGAALPPVNFSILCIDVNTINQTMNVTFRTNESGAWLDAQTNTSVTNGTYHLANKSWVDTGNTTYYWSVNVTDNTTWTNNTYSFSTAAAIVLDVLNEYPTNDTNILVVQPTLNFNLTISNGVSMNYTIYIGNTSSTCNTFLFSKGSVGNGSQVNSSHQYTFATGFYQDYYWRVQANGGTTWINETFHYQSIRQAGGASTNLGGVYALAAGGVCIGFLALMFAMHRRRKK